MLACVHLVPLSGGVETCSQRGHVCMQSSAHLVDVRLLAHTNLPPHTADVPSVRQRLDSQEIVTHIGQPITIILLVLVMDELVPGQCFDAFVCATMPAFTNAGTVSARCVRT
jgi:hypothetical protein